MSEEKTIHTAESLAAMDERKAAVMGGVVSGALSGLAADLAAGPVAVLLADVPGNRQRLRFSHQGPACGLTGAAGGVIGDADPRRRRQPGVAAADPDL